MKRIGVLDCNNFFVSCERLLRPDLQNKPVIVLSGNDGCVVARSKEVKDMGIPMGVPYFQIKDTIKEIEAVVFSSNFALYKDISRRVFEVLRTEFPSLEQYSIDEAFFYIDENELSKIEMVKKKIERWVGIPVSVGVAGSKTQAKYVNTVAKRTGLVEVWNREKWSDEIDKIKLTDVWGVGKSLATSFKKQNLIYVSDLLALSLRDLHARFGVVAVRLRSELTGVPVFLINGQNREKKSIMSSNSLSYPTNETSLLESEFSRHVHSVTQDLFINNLLAGKLKIALYPSRFSDFYSYGFALESKFDTPTNDIFILTKEAISLFRRGFCEKVPYKRVVVTVSDLVNADFIPNDLFVSTKKDSDKTSDVSKLLFTINEKHKTNLIRLVLQSDNKNTSLIRKKYLSPKYTTSWTDLKIVRT